MVLNVNNCTLKIKIPLVLTHLSQVKTSGRALMSIFTKAAPLILFPTRGSKSKRFGRGSYCRL